MPGSGSTARMMLRRSRSSRITPARTPAFAERVATAAEDLLGIMPAWERRAAVAREPDSPAAEAGLLEEPARPVVVEPVITPEQDELERGPAACRRAQRCTGRGLDYADWRDKALVRAGSVVVEFHGGAVFGDVNRSMWCAQLPNSWAMTPTASCRSIPTSTSPSSVAAPSCWAGHRLRPVGGRNGHLRWLLAGPEGPVHRVGVVQADRRWRPRARLRPSRLGL